MAKKRILDSYDEVPTFASEDEEVAFWDAHELGNDLLNKMQPVDNDVLPQPRSRTTPVAIRFDEVTLKRVKKLAERRHKGYQTLLKEFVTERLYEEEKREGLL